MPRVSSTSSILRSGLERSGSARTSLYWPQVYIGVALTTLATLLLELALTRIFSVSLYYHFAFLVISIALFGLGAGGVLSYLVATARGRLFDKLGLLAAVNSVVVLAALVIMLSGPTNSGLSEFKLPVIYFVAATPFLLAGAVVSLAISETIERVDRVYFFDLLGAAGGCLLLIPFLNSFGGPNTVIAAAVLYASSATIWFSLAGSGRGRIAGVTLGLVLTSLFVYNARFRAIDVRYAKGMQLGNEMFVKWNSFSRITVGRPKDYDTRRIYIDADASTDIASFDFNNLTGSDRAELSKYGMALPYALRPGAKTLIIGPGGGWDVARALASGSKDVTGVEINPIIAETIMKDRFAEYSKRLYFRPEVRIFVEDGRSFVRRSNEKYQVLQATLVDTWASTAAGAFALSENNLYTTEAFYDYLTHLTDDGLMAFTRWGFDPPRESLRVVALARTALDRLGECCAHRHIIITREGSVEGWGALDTVLVSRKPFTDAEVALVRQRANVIYAPGDKPQNPFGQYLLSSDPDAFVRGYQYDVSPVTDNRPFFFYTVQPHDLWAFVKGAGRASADYKVNSAVPVMFVLLALSIAATLIVLTLPPAILGSRLPREPGVRAYLLYFVAIGIGYILIQVSLIQRFVLFLGHPTYALTVVVFSMLVFSSLGSYFSRRFIAGSDRKLSITLGAVAASVGLLALTTNYMPVHWPLWAKFLLTTLQILPAGFLMGMPFPTGLIRLERWHNPSVRWAWSLNAASSVLGSVSALFLAIYLGLRETLLIGGLLYLAALVTVRLTSDRASSKQPLPSH